MTRKEARNTEEMLQRLTSLGIARDDAETLRRISMTLHRWFELECNGDIERDEVSGKPYWYWTDYQGNRKPCNEPTPDREAGAKRRLAKLMARYPALQVYIQTDPRGCALYILRPGDVPAGADVSAYYSRGIAVHR